MEALLYILQTCGLSFIFVVLLKTVSLLRNLLLRTALKIRKKHNQKYNLAPNYGINEINVNSLKYQIDSIEGGIVAIILFSIGLLWTLFIPMKKDNLFSIFALVLSIAEFLYCWFVRNSGTNKYRTLVLISCILSLLLITHAIIFYTIDFMGIVGRFNCINAVLYIWSTMLMYKMLLDRK